MIISIGFKRDDNDSGVTYDVFVPEQARLDSDKLEVIMARVNYSCESCAATLKSILGKGATVTRREQNSTQF